MIALTTCLKTFTIAFEFTMHALALSVSFTLKMCVLPLTISLGLRMCLLKLNLSDGANVWTPDVMVESWLKHLQNLKSTKKTKNVNFET